jgi:itaconate CoA-transferase
MYAYSSILAALIARGTSGVGRRIDVSMLESMVEWMSYPMYYAYRGAEPPPRAGAAHATIYPYGPFPAGDGGIVMLGLQNEREWKVFCEKALALPELATDPRFDSNARRNENRAELRAAILEVFGTMTAELVIARLEQAQIANAHVNTVADLWDHPQLQARGRFRQVGSPAGPIAALLPPGTSNSFDYRMDAVPGIGDHSEAILRELGRGDEAIARLRAAKAT